MVDILNLLLSVLSFVMTPLIMLAGWLMSPDWTMGDIFNMRDMLHQLWVLVSNVVYVVFAFILVVMAFRNIFGDAKDYWAMKTGLPKLLVGVLMVPFTWFIVSGTLSVANYITASAIQLPASMINTSSTNNLLKNIWVPNRVVVDLTQKANTSTGRLDSDGEKSNDSTKTVGYTGSSNFYSVDCDEEGNRDDGSIEKGTNGQTDYCINAASLMTNG